MPLPKIPSEIGIAALVALNKGDDQKENLAAATRFILQELNRISPGRSVEVRVPPYGAVQIVEGPGHTRGTPSNVVELSPGTLVSLALGRVTWEETIQSGAVIASGNRVDLSKIFPLKIEAK